MFTRSALLLLALLAFALPEYGMVSGNRRQLMFDRKEICQALSSFSLTVTQGNCSGFAQLDCKAVIDGLTNTKTAFEKWWKKDLCNEGEVKHIAEMSSKLIVSVWVEAAAGITCDGQGYGCGFSITNGDWVNAAGRALAKAANEAGGKALGFCAEDLRLLGVDEPVLIEEARAEACTSGGGKTSFESRFSSTLQKSIHISLLDATANLCDWGGSAKSICPAGDKSKLKPVKTMKPGKSIARTTVAPAPESTEPAESDAEVSDPVEDDEKTSQPIDTNPAAASIAVEVKDDEKIPQPAAAPNFKDSEEKITQPVEEGTQDADEGLTAKTLEEVAASPAEITAAFDNPLLDEIIIGVDPVQVTPPEKFKNGEPATAEEAPEKVTDPACTCEKDLCKDASCDAFPFATCSTVSNNGDCSDCSAKFFIDSKQVTCRIDLCKPKGSLCANKSLAKCCGVCCRCGTFFSKVTAKKEGLELGFCQEGSNCNCIDGLRG